MSRLKSLRKKVQDLIDEYNRNNPDRLTIRIVWGSADVEDDQTLAQFGQRQALVEYCKQTFELSLGRRSTPDETDRLRLNIHFNNPRRLPRDSARRLYNVFATCEESVYPMLSPDPESDSEIIVYGIEVSVPLHAITGKVLEDALNRLSLSAASSYHWLVEGDEEGYDKWKLDRKLVKDDDEA